MVDAVSYGREQWQGRFEDLCEKLEMNEIGEVEFFEKLMALGLKEIDEIMHCNRTKSRDITETSTTETPP